MHRDIERLECKKDYQKISSDNQNALNFLLSTILGRLVASDNGSSYAIISKDTGLDVIINYWKSIGVKITRSTAIKEVLGKSEPAPAAPAAPAPAPAAPAAPATPAEPETEKAEETDKVVDELFTSNEGFDIDIDKMLNTRDPEKS